MAEEVSTRALEIPFRYLKRKKIDVKTLLEDIGVHTERFYDARYRVDWAVFVILLRRIGQSLGGSQALTRIGHEILDIRVLRPLKLIFRLFASLEVVYDFLTTKSGQVLYFSNILGKMERV